MTAALGRTHTRLARADELEEVYRMGFDAWGGGASLEAYLSQCASSRKYVQGSWYVLEADGALTSALIRYREAFGLPDGAWGIGSLATSPRYRRRGCASTLMEGVLALEIGPVFIHADIAPGFYCRFGFAELPAAMQLRPGSVMMARGLPQANLIPPAYF